MGLSKDLQEVAGALARSASHRVQRVQLDDTTVTVNIEGLKEIQVVYFTPDSYPQSAAMVMCSDDNDLSARLEPINEQFEEYAVLMDVLKAICQALDIDGDELMLDADDGEGGSADGDARSGSGDDEDDDDDRGAWHMAEAGNEELLKSVLQKVSRWARLEDARAAEEQAAAKAAAEAASSGASPGSGSPGAALSQAESLARRNQIFNPAEGFAMLSKELRELMQDPDLPWEVDAVKDDVYRWEVRLTRFDESSPLAQDLAQLQRAHGCAEVVLRLTFKRGLHPFYPPALQLLRPRLAGPVPAALASHPALRLDHWDPWRTQKQLLQLLRGFLGQVARVDLGSALNGAAREVAYTRLERLLAHLEALTGLAPACAAQHAAIYRHGRIVISARDAGVDSAHLAALAPSVKRAKTGDEAGRGGQPRAWVSGTGYGSGSRGGEAQVWDARQAASAQDAQDEELRRVLCSLATVMGRVPPSAPERAESAAGGPALQDATGALPLPCDLDLVDLSEDGVLGEEARCAALGASCLLPFLEAELSRASFADMCTRSQFYLELLAVARCLARRGIDALLHQPQTPAGAGARAPRCVAALLGELQAQAANFLNVLRAGGGDAAAPAPAGSCAAAAVAAHAAAAAHDALRSPEQEERSSRALANAIVDCAMRAKELAPSARVTRSRGAQAASNQPAAGAAGGTAPSDDEIYIEAMRSLQLAFAEGLGARSHYQGAAAREGAQPRARLVRVGKEVASLGTDLPLNPSSSVFIRVDEQNMVLWQALITGPDNTPYSGGCFLFDFYFPPSYPSTPPQVNLATTGAASVRFNPNLYNCGKVCLSLLGTWSAGKGEGWEAASSTALQVLVSIQSLIFVDEPYFNEPGFEATMHTERGRGQSKAYNLNIREQTMHWAIWQQLKSPPAGFEDVVCAHFKRRRASILDACEAWVREAEAERAASAGRMRTFLNNIKAEMDKL